MRRMRRFVARGGETAGWRVVICATLWRDRSAISQAHSGDAEGSERCHIVGPRRRFHSHILTLNLRSPWALVCSPGSAVHSLMLGESNVSRRGITLLPPRAGRLFPTGIRFRDGARSPFALTASTASCVLYRVRRPAHSLTHPLSHSLTRPSFSLCVSRIAAATSRVLELERGLEVELLCRARAADSLCPLQLKADCQGADLPFSTRTPVAVSWETAHKASPEARGRTRRPTQFACHAQDSVCDRVKGQNQAPPMCRSVSRERERRRNRPPSSPGT